MSQTNVQVGRARFDNADAKGVVIFLQEGDGQGFGPAHRGWSRHDLATKVLSGKPLPMVLTESLIPTKKQLAFADFQAFTDKLVRLKAEVELEPELWFAGYSVEAEFRWTRPVTELEVVAAKAYMRDREDLPIKKQKYAAPRLEPEPVRYDEWQDPLAETTATGTAARWVVTNSSSAESVFQQAVASATATYQGDITTNEDAEYEAMVCDQQEDGQDSGE